MRSVHRVLVPGLLAFTALAALPQGAQAGCTPSLISDGKYNTCVGSGVLANQASTAAANTAVGAGAMTLNTTGGNNTAIGNAALYNNSTAAANTAVGVAALYNNVTGSNNTAVGLYAGGKQTGSYNTSLGFSAGVRDGLGGLDRITGSYNLAIGYQAGSQWTTGSNNIAIANPGNTADLKTIRIGTADNQTRAFIAGINGASVASASAAVLIDANGQLGTVRSSIRYKQDVQDMGDASDPLLQLRPVTFHYKQADADGSRPLQYGLIAEEVAKVMPGLVVNNAEGQPETVAYHLLPSLLLNEFQKQHAELAEAKATLAALEQSQESQLDAMEDQIASLRLAVGRMAAAPEAGLQRVAGSASLATRQTTE